MRWKPQRETALKAIKSEAVRDDGRQSHPPGCTSIAARVSRLYITDKGYRSHSKPVFHSLPCRLRLENLGDAPAYINVGVEIKCQAPIANLDASTRPAGDRSLFFVKTSGLNVLKLFPDPIRKFRRCSQLSTPASLKNTFLRYRDSFCNSQGA